MATFFAAFFREISGVNGEFYRQQTEFNSRFGNRHAMEWYTTNANLACLIAYLLLFLSMSSIDTVFIVYCFNIYTVFFKHFALDCQAGKVFLIALLRKA